MDPASIDFKSNMDSLNMFMRERGLPRSLKIALRTYFHNSRRLHRAHAEGHLIGMMSPLMQSTVALQANKSWLDRIWFLRADWYTGDSQLVHSAFVASISQKLKTQACIGQERVAGGLLCIVNRGLAIKSWRFRSAGGGAGCCGALRHALRPSSTWRVQKRALRTIAIGVSRQLALSSSCPASPLPCPFHAPRPYVYLVPVHVHVHVRVPRPCNTAVSYHIE